MSSFAHGLPSSPRVTRQTLSPLNTSSMRPTTSTSTSPAVPSPYADSVSSKGSSPQTFVENKRSRDIFAEATIPLSPISTSSTMVYKEQPFDGLAPKQRNGFARLFCCFGREERARRRAERFSDFEKVGEKCHWTEQ